MIARLVGGGLASLSAAVYLIKHGGVRGQDIYVYDAGSRLGGAMAMSGGPTAGYILPTGRVFERQYRCAFDLFSLIPSASDPLKSIKDEIEEFNQRYGYDDRARIVDRRGRVIKSEHFGLSVADRLNLIKVALTSEDALEGKRIDEFFSEEFFRTEFWLLWAPLMGSLSQHSALEFRRFMIRFLELLPSLSTMKTIYRTRFNQYEGIVEPITNWLRARSVNLLTDAFVTSVGFKPSVEEITATSLVCECNGEQTHIAVGRDDMVLVTNGSQVADLCIGSMTEPAKLSLTGRSWALWDSLARGRPEFGIPRVFFGEGNISDTKWMTFTVTTTDPTFFEFMTALTGVEVGRSGLMTFKDSNWLITVAIFHQPEFVGQPSDVMVWWGFALYPDKTGNFVKKPMSECNGAEIMEETLRHARFESRLEAIMSSSTCIPCVLPYAGSVWTVRKQSDRPKVVPDGSTNFGFIGQFSELPKDACFTMEYSVRSAREAVSTLLKLDAKPPPVYQGSHDPHAIYEAVKVLFA